MPAIQPISAPHEGALLAWLLDSRIIEQSGIFAGKDGFHIKVAGATDLKGGVIASEAVPALNLLQTGTLSASDIHNEEHYSAQTLGIGVGLGANLGKDAGGNINTDGTGHPLPGIHTALGTLPPFREYLALFKRASGALTGLEECQFLRKIGVFLKYDFQYTPKSTPNVDMSPQILIKNDEHGMGSQGHSLPRHDCIVKTVVG